MIINPKKILTPRELERFLADDWAGFDIEMRKRLKKVKPYKQIEILRISSFLAHRECNRRNLRAVHLFNPPIEHFQNKLEIDEWEN